MLHIVGWDQRCDIHRRVSSIDHVRRPCYGNCAGRLIRDPAEIYSPGTLYFDKSLLCSIISSTRIHFLSCRVL